MLLDDIQNLPLEIIKAFASKWKKMS